MLISQESAGVQTGLSRASNRALPGLKPGLAGAQTGPGLRRLRRVAAGLRARGHPVLPSRSGSHVVLSRPAAPALAGNDLAADEQLSSPHAPRLPALDRTGQARGPDRAVAAQRLGKLNVVG